MANPIRAVIFDMDGVLIDAKEWHYEALNRALGLFGFHINRYEHLVTFDGLPTRAKLAMLTKDRGLPAGLHEVINGLKQKYTMEIVHRECKPLFQHEYALSRLKAKGYKLAVASNSVRNSVEVMMQKSGLARFLDALVSNEDVKKGKPDPEIYLKTLDLLNVSPGECLVVEDNENGIKSAQTAGCPVMIVRDVLDVTDERITQELSTLQNS
ncbi:MAG TPA: HAD family phosphatase [Chthoniobacterales bacterium]